MLAQAIIKLFSSPLIIDSVETSISRGIASTKTISGIGFNLLIASIIADAVIEAKQGEDAVRRNVVDDEPAMEEVATEEVVSEPVTTEEA